MNSRCLNHCLLGPFFVCYGCTPSLVRIEEFELNKSSHKSKKRQSHFVLTLSSLLFQLSDILLLYFKKLNIQFDSYCMHLIQFHSVPILFYLYLYDRRFNRFTPEALLRLLQTIATIGGSSFCWQHQQQGIHYIRALGDTGCVRRYRQQWQ
jgi:hypothetical protein